MRISMQYSDFGYNKYGEIFRRFQPVSILIFKCIYTEALFVKK
ncbi:MAG: hypothetical protein JWO92_25 [Chitinophagaceae bacterium]|nr:hypothetical protein [Chitinophagaceae bacterium]